MYVIAGITGNTGRAAAQALIDQGHTVRGLTRDAAAASVPGAELVQLDLADTDALTRALTGAQGAYLLIPPSWTTPDYFAYAKPLIESIGAAVRAADVPRVVILSSMGAQHPTGTGPIAILYLLEQELAGRAGVTFLRPSYFQENLAGSLEPAGGGTLPVFIDPAQKISMVATRDIGAEAARQLLISPDQAQSIVQLAGPVDYSFTDVAEALSELLARPVAPMQLPPLAIVEPLRQMGAGHIAELYGEMNEGLQSGLVAFDAQRSVERGSTSLRSTLAQLIGAVPA